MQSYQILSTYCNIYLVIFPSVMKLEKQCDLLIHDYERVQEVKDRNALIGKANFIITKFSRLINYRLCWLDTNKVHFKMKWNEVILKEVWGKILSQKNPITIEDRHARKQHKRSNGRKLMDQCDQNDGGSPNRKWNKKLARSYSQTHRYNQLDCNNEREREREGWGGGVVCLV